MTDDRRPPKGPPPPPPPAPPLPSRSTPVRRPRGSRGAQQVVWIGLVALGLFAAGFVGWALNSMSRSGDPQPGENHLALRPQQPAEGAQPSQGNGSNTARQEGAGGPAFSRESQTQPTTTGTPEPRSDPNSDKPDASPLADKPMPNKPTTPKSKPAPGTGLGDQPKPTTAKAPTKTLYQEVVVWRRPTFVVSGITISQDLKYRVLSKLSISDGKDGARKVKQEIYETKLEKADGLSEAVFADSLEKMQGQAFTYTVDAKGDIIEFAGPKDNRKNVKVDDVGGLTGQAFLMSSVMDDDGWKELAQLTFLLPEKPVKTLRKGQRWERKITHDWGSLGSWYGKTTYQHAGAKDGEHLVQYVHRLAYVPPGKGKKQKKSPLEINSAAFKTVQTNGEVHFDAVQGRVARAREWFHVRGAVSTSVLGQSTQVQVEEQQYFAIRVVDRLD